MDHRARGAAQRLEGALDQFGTRLHDDLDRHVVRDQVLLDQLTHEVEVDLARRREPDLDLLEAHGDELPEQPVLARQVHGLRQRLVAVTEVHRAPERSLAQLACRPPAVRQLRADERLVAMHRHTARLLDGAGQGGAGREGGPFRKGA